MEQTITHRRVDQRVGLAATISIVAALASYLLVFTAHPYWGFLAALLSIPSGVIGLIMAASPRVRGGIISIIAIILGVLALVLSILGMVGVALF